MGISKDVQFFHQESFWVDIKGIFAKYFKKRNNKKNFRLFYNLIKFSYFILNFFKIFKIYVYKNLRIIIREFYF